MLRLSTSLREDSPASTYDKAWDFGKQLGITRVAEITRLDRIGIPVYACIRPYAHERSLSVHAGKGLKKEDAKASALMEGIEFALAEIPNVDIPMIKKSPLQVFGDCYAKAVLEYCPMYGKRIEGDQPISWVEVAGVCSSENFMAPADLLFHPLPDIPAQPSYFGSSTNGLASGNSVDEATVHGLLEVIERDIESFRLVHDRSFLVPLDSIPECLRPSIALFEKAALELYIRYVPNRFGVAYFAAFVLEKHEAMPIFAAEGFGCHPNKEIALTRAITEAAQSRLSHIHGGRDDVIDRYQLFREGDSNVKELDHNRKFRLKVASGTVLAYHEIEESKRSFKNSQEIVRWLSDRLIHLGFTKVGRVVLTSTSDPIAVVRVIVPGLEALNSITKRVGQRLVDYVTENLIPLSR